MKTDVVHVADYFVVWIIKRATHSSGHNTQQLRTKEQAYLCAIKTGSVKNDRIRRFLLGVLFDGVPLLSAAERENDS